MTPACPKVFGLQHVSYNLSFSSHQLYRKYRLFLTEYQHIRLKIDSILGRFLIRQLAEFCLGVWRKNPENRTLFQVWDAGIWLFGVISFGQLAGFRARFLCNKCANNYMLSNVVGALYALFTSVLMYYLVQEPLGTKSGASKIANNNKQICLIYFDYISLQRCKV